MLDIFSSNSVWPNALKKDEEGYVTFYPLGTNKVDISTITWPEGDKLISPFVYQDDRIVGFVDTKAMTVSGSGTTTMNYSHIEADFSSISEGKLTVNAPNAIVKKFTWLVTEDDDNTIILGTKYSECKNGDEVVAVDAEYLTNDIIDGYWSQSLVKLESAKSSSNGLGIFSGCKTLKSFNSDLTNLSSAYYMFYNCTELVSFICTGLPNLIDGDSMFRDCKALTSFNYDVSTLTEATYMFQNCVNLTSFEGGNLSSLTDGNSMFSGCTNLTSFNSDLSSLTAGYWMFGRCSKLTSFNSNLSSLNQGYSMFYNCKLDAPSFKNIFYTISQRASKPVSGLTLGYTTIGLGIPNTEEAKQAMAEELGCIDWNTVKNSFDAKNWSVTFQFNGEVSTYDLRSPKHSTAIFVKLEEVTEEDNLCTHTSQDGTKHYTLLWYHDSNTDNEGYDYFESLEEAIESLNIKPIERN